MILVERPYQFYEQVGWPLSNEVRMKFAIILIVYIALCAIAIATLWSPLRRAIDSGRNHQGRVIAVSAVLVVLMAVPVLGVLIPSGPACFLCQRVGNVLLGYIMYFFGFLLIVRVIGFLVIGLPHRRRHHERWEPSRKISAATLCAVLALAVGLNIWGAYAAQDVRVTRYEIPKEQLGLDEPFRIALIADLHIGVNSSPELYEEMAALVNEQEPDLVLVAGDIITSSYDAMGDSAPYVGAIAGIESTYGKYAIYGNHDVDEPLIAGFTFSDPENTERNPRLDAFMESCGCTVLEDQVVEIPELNGLTIAGRRDVKRPGDGIASRKSLSELLEHIDTSAPIILLEHEPMELDQLDRFGIGLSVSGHTHDGQIFPGNVFSRIASPQSYGLKNWGNAVAVVTSGVGYYGPPIRVGTISEVVIIEAR